MARIVECISATFRLYDTYANLVVKVRALMKLGDA